MGFIANKEMVKLKKDDHLLSDQLCPLYTPDNEPYRGNEKLHIFDLTIIGAMQVHTEVGQQTFNMSLSPLQTAVSEIVPQGVSIVLSIRELIRP